MTYRELVERCKGRVYDQIVVAAEDAFTDRGLVCGQETDGRKRSVFL